MSFGLAVLICLQGFVMAEDAVQEQPQPTVKQEQATPVPASEPETEISDASEPREEKREEETGSPEPTKEVTAEPTKEVTPEPTAEVTAEPTTEVTEKPTAEATSEPTPGSTAALRRFACASGEVVAAGETVRLEAEFSDPASLVKVQIYVDDVLMKEVPGSAFEERGILIYETADLTIGEHWAQIVWMDASEGTNASEKISITIVALETDEPTPETTQTPICGLQEHAHTDKCYDSDGALNCGLDVHAHTAACFAQEQPALDEEDQSAEDVPSSGEIIAAPRDYSVLWKGVVPSDERGMAIPMLFQGDYRQTVCTYRGTARSVATSGCGATSLSMVIAYLTDNTQQNPYSLFCQSVDDGRYYGSGWSHDTLSHYARLYGVKSQWITNDADAILQALRDGKPVIAHMGPGIFTSRGHYLVLRGVTEDGLVLMNDPASRSNCERAFPIETLLKQAKTSQSFMICWTDDEKTKNDAQTERIWGDVNGSGELDINDAQLLYEMLSAGEADLAFDFNGDETVDQADLELLTEAILDPQRREELAVQSTVIPDAENEGGEKI